MHSTPPEQNTPERSSGSVSDDLDSPGPSSKTPTSNNLRYTDLEAPRSSAAPNKKLFEGKPIEKSGRFGRSYHVIDHEVSIFYLEITVVEDGKWKAMFEVSNLNTWDFSFNLDINYGANSPPSITLNGRIMKGQDPRTKRYIYQPISCTWPASQIKKLQWKQQIGPPHEDNTVAEIWEACTDKSNSLVALYVIEWECKTAILEGFEDGFVDRKFDRGDLKGTQSDAVDFMKAVQMYGGRMTTIVPRDTFSESWERHTLKAMRNRLMEGDWKDDIPIRRKASAPRAMRTGDGAADESNIVDMTEADPPTTDTLSSLDDEEDSDDSAAGADLEEPLRRGDALYDIDGTLVLPGVTDAADEEDTSAITEHVENVALSDDMMATEHIQRAAPVLPSIVITEHVGRTATDRLARLEPAPYPENNIEVDDVDVEDKAGEGKEKVPGSPGPLMSTAKKAMSALMGGRGPFY
jgi:hypothetical protein